jgi:hypothetical protein
VRKHNFFLKKTRRSGRQLVLGNVLEIKFIEMGKSAVPAPDGKVPAADGQVMGTGDMAVAAGGRLNKFPEIVAADLRERSFFANILDPGYENPGSPAVIAGNLCLVRYRHDDLVGNLFAVVTVSPVPREDEPFAHGRV